VKEIRIQFILSNCYRYCFWIFYRLLYLLRIDRFIPRCYELWYLSAVACDGDVLCHCTASLKPFVLGSLLNKTFTQIWQGDSYNKLRHDMIRGKLPHYRCVGCARLKESELKRKLEQSNHEPRLSKLFIEPTVLCNLKCISCQNRNAIPTRKNYTFSIDMLRSLLKDVKPSLKVMYPFFDGEIFVTPKAYEMLRIIREEVPEVFIHFHTNGVLLDTPAKRQELIGNVDHIVMSIDGATPDSYLKYRRGGNFQKAYENMKMLIREREEAGEIIPRVDWKYLLFRWNSSEEEIALTMKLALEAGVDRLMLEPTIRPFWGISLKGIMNKNKYRKMQFGRIYEDRIALSAKEKRVKPKSQIDVLSCSFTIPIK